MSSTRPSLVLQPSNLHDLTRHLLEQVQPFENFSGILLKAQCDGYLDTFFRVFDGIFRRERQYTVDGMLTRGPQGPPQRHGPRDGGPADLQSIHLQRQHQAHRRRLQ